MRPINLLTAIKAMEEEIEREIRKEQKALENSSYLISIFPNTLKGRFTASVWSIKKGLKNKDYYADIEISSIKKGKEVSSEMYEYCEKVQRVLEELNRA